MSKENKISGCLANKSYSATKEYGKGSLGENGLNVKHINSSGY